MSLLFFVLQFVRAKVRKKSEKRKVKSEKLLFLFKFRMFHMLNILEVSG